MEKLETLFRITKYLDSLAIGDKIESLLKQVYVDAGYTHQSIGENIFRLEEIKKRGDILLATDSKMNLAGMVICALPNNPYRQVAESDEAEMQLLAVNAQWRGQGWGKKLCLAFENQATRLGFSKLVLSTQITMKPAHALYEKLGYRRDPSRDWTRSDRQFLVYIKTLH